MVVGDLLRDVRVIHPWRASSNHFFSAVRRRPRRRVSEGLRGFHLCCWLPVDFRVDPLLLMVSSVRTTALALFPVPSSVGENQRPRRIVRIPARSRAVAGGRRRSGEASCREEEAAEKMENRREVDRNDSVLSVVDEVCETEEDGTRPIHLLGFGVVEEVDHSEEGFHRSEESSLSAES